MTSILTIKSNALTIASSLTATVADAILAFAAAFDLPRAARPHSISDRLRYDTGELDINPDCRSRSGLYDRSPGAKREMMRRGF